MTKPFMSLLALTVVLGLVLGGVFSAGVALGKRQGQQTAFAQGPDLHRQQSRNQLGQGGLNGVIEKVDGDTVTINTFRGAAYRLFPLHPLQRILSPGAAS